jgi:hypothetical protein
MLAAHNDHGFNRSTQQNLRNRLNELRDNEGRRLNDVLADMLAAYQNGKD